MKARRLLVWTLLLFWTSSSVVLSSELPMELFSKSFEFHGTTYNLSSIIAPDDTLAQAICLSHGGYLAEIETQEEDTAVRNFLNGTRDTLEIKGVLISGTDREVENKFVYQYSGRELEYKNFARNEPNNFRGGESCIQMRRITNFLWNDIECGGREMLFLCEIPDMSKKRACTKGKYGLDCLLTCSSNCEEGECDPDNGHCTLGCTGVYTGDMCDLVCERGRYGETCQYNCSQNCKDGDCHPRLGLCYGCTDGFIDDRCEEEVSADIFSGTNGLLVGAGIGVGVTGLVCVLLTSVYCCWRRSSRAAKATRQQCPHDLQGLDGQDEHHYNVMYGSDDENIQPTWATSDEVSTNTPRLMAYSEYIQLNDVTSDEVCTNTPRLMADDEHIQPTWATSDEVCTNTPRLIADGQYIQLNDATSDDETTLKITKAESGDDASHYMNSDMGHYEVPTEVTEGADNTYYMKIL